MPFSMPPGLRIPYDSDGTIGLVHPSVSLGGGVLDLHANALRALNTTMGSGMYVPGSIWADGDARSETAIDADAANTPFICMIFPVPTRLRGFFFSRAAEQSGSPTDTDDIRKYFSDRVYVEASKDSSNGIDGVWEPLGIFVRGDIPWQPNATPGISAVSGATATSGAGVYTRSRAVKDVFRNVYDESQVGIHSFAGVAARQVKALRIYPLTPNSNNTSSANARGWYFLHLYGEPDTDALGQNWLQAWRSDSNMRLGGATLSWGDVQVASSSDKSFRIKNQSTTKTANDIVISVEDPLYYPAHIADQFVMSLDEETWTSTLTIGAIGPETISPTIYLRRVTPADSPLTTYSPKIRFDVTGGWS